MVGQKFFIPHTKCLNCFNGILPFDVVKLQLIISRIQLPEAKLVIGFIICFINVFYFVEQYF